MLELLIIIIYLKKIKLSQRINFFKINKGKNKKEKL
jgi:hypothetical protein